MDFSPDWSDVFSTQLARMKELKFELYNDVEEREPKKLSECVISLTELRGKGKDRTVIRFSQKMKPLAEITAETTFFPKVNHKVKRGKAVLDHKRLHKGHRYEPNYFPQIVKCAFCHDILWGFLQAQGLKCQNCDRAVHTR